MGQSSKDGAEGCKDSQVGAVGQLRLLHMHSHTREQVCTVLLTQLFQLANGMMLAALQRAVSNKEVA